MNRWVGYLLVTDLTEERSRVEGSAGVCGHLLEKCVECCSEWPWDSVNSELQLQWERKKGGGRGGERERERERERKKIEF